MRKKIFWFLVLLLLGIWAALPFVAKFAEKKFNKTRQLPPYQFSQQALQLHNKLLIADIHADPLLWDRELTLYEDYGHLDLPRMKQANLGLQVFGIVTQSPKGQNFTQNHAHSDRLTPLVMLQQWPFKTWDSWLERALHQAEKLAELSQSFSSEFTIISKKEDLQVWSKAYKAGEPTLAGLLAIEGAHALEGNPENFGKLYQAGIRMIGLAHFIDNQFAGSAHGSKQHGLTTKGRILVGKAWDNGVVIDLAHASRATFSDVLEITPKPVVVSHTGVQGVCNSPRNLSDEQIKSIAANRGVIGVAIFKGATCGTDLKAMLDTIDYLYKLVGADTISLGLDLDGAVTSPIDVTGLPLITQGLIERGYSESEIQKIMGLNLIRVLEENLTN